MARIKSFQEYIEKNFSAVLEESAEEYLYDHAGTLQVEREKDITLRDIDFSEVEVHRVWTEDSPGTEIDFAVIIRAYYQGYGGNKYGESDDYVEWIQMDCKGDLSNNLRDFRVFDMSEYDYRNKPDKTLSEGLVPYMKRTELEFYAKQLLDAFWPELYKDHIPVEPETLAKRMGLKVFERRLTSDCSIFGEMIFATCSLDVYDEERKEIHKETFTAGTILVDPDIAFIRGLGTKNTTIIHECVHWFYHRKAFELVRLCNEEASRIECHVNGELKAVLTDKESSFIEWQANALPTYIMAPEPVLKLKVNELFNNYEHERESDDAIDFIEDVIRDVADFFGFSKQAAKIRMVQCGFEIARGAFEYVDGHYVRPYQGKKGELKEDETYTASVRDILIAGMLNPELMEKINDRTLVFADCHLVANNPKYLTEDIWGRTVLSQYALNHADECMIKFHAEISSTLKANGFSLECILCRDQNTGVSLRLEYVGEANKDPIAKYNAYQRLENDIKAGISCVVHGNQGETLEQLMEWAGNYKAKDVAELIGVEPKTVERWLAGKNKMNKRAITAVCVALKLPYKVGLEFHNGLDCPLAAQTQENIILDFFLKNAESGTLTVYDCNKILESYNYSPLIG